jgi:hypothetical protein
MADGEQPKIIVDDDWKSQAQAEKAKLAEEAKAEEAQSPEGGLPEKIGFTDLVRMFATQALMYMGAFPDPQTGKAVVALDVAKMNIDLLGVLEEKTKGNLDEEEKSLLEESVAALRSQFVEITRLVGQAQAEGRIGPDGSIRDAGGADGAAPGTPDLGV